MHNVRKGFTLIELVIVMGILSVLMSIVVVAVNPAKQFSDANDTKRRSDIKAILDAIEQYAATNRGDISVLALTAAPKKISNSETGDEFCNAIMPTYIAAIPSDPLNGTGAAENGKRVRDCTLVYDTGYSVSQNPTTHRIEVTATNGAGEIITIIR